MEQNIIVPPHEAVFEITSLAVVVQDFGLNPIGMQFVYADLFESVLHLKKRIQERMGVPIAFMEWLSSEGQGMFDENIVAQFVWIPHSIIVVTLNEDWPPPGFQFYNLLPPPPPAPLPPPPPPVQQAESTTLTYESTGSNDGGNDVVEGGGVHDGPVEVVNGGVNLQVCDDGVSVINKLVDVSGSDILSDMLDNANISSYLAIVFVKDPVHTLVKHIKGTYFAVESQNSEIELTETLQNLEEYVTMIMDATSNSGNLRHGEAFKSGFNQAFDHLVGAVLSPERPFVATVYSSKLSSEIGAIESLLEKGGVVIQKQPRLVEAACLCK